MRVSGFVIGIAATLGRTLAIVIAFVFALGTSLALHLNLPLARESLSTRVTDALEPILKGEVRIEHIGHVGVAGVSGGRVRIVDPAGRRVATAEGVGARLSYVRLLRSFLFEGNLDFDISLGVIDHLDLALDSDRWGTLRLVSALDPDPLSRRRASALARPNSKRPVSVTVRDLWLRHAWLHGTPEGLPAIDADVSEVSGFFSVRQESVDTAIRSSTIRGRGAAAGANPNGQVSGRVMIPAGDGQSFWLGGSFDGDIGGVRTTATATLDHGKANFEIDANASPEGTRSLAPEIRLPGQVLFHADGFGTWPDVNARAEIRFGRTVVDLDADGTLGRNPRASGRILAHHVDLRDAIGGAPESDIDGAGAVAISVEGGVWRGGFHVKTSAGRLEGHALPGVTTLGGFTGWRAHAQASIEEPGAPTLAALRLHPSRRGPVLDIDASCHVPDLTRVRRLGTQTKGRAELRLDGWLELSTRKLDVDLALDVRKLSRGVDIDRARLDAHADGSLDAPRFRGSFRGGPLSFPGFRVTEFSGDASGAPPSASTVALSLGGPRDPNRLVATTEVAISQGIELRRFRVLAGTGAEGAALRADAVNFEGESLIVRNGVLSGAGDPLAFDVSASPKRLNVTAHSKDVDLGRLTALLGIQRRQIRGHLAADVDISAAPSKAEGHVKLDLTKAGLNGARGGSAHCDLTLRDRTLAGALGVVGLPGRFEVRTSGIQLGGTPTSMKSWMTAQGRIDVDGDGDLAALRRSLPDALPVGELGGRGSIRGSASRSGSDRFIDADLTVRTVGLSIAGLGEKGAYGSDKTERGPAEWRSTGADLDLTFQRKSGEERLQGHFHDKTGTLLDLDAKSSLQLENRRAPSAFFDVPFQLHVDVPRRRLSELPPFLRAAGANGTAEGTLEATQTLNDPKIRFVGKVRGFEPPGHVMTSPLDLDIAADYANRAGSAVVSAKTGDSDGLELTAQLHGALPALVRRQSDDWDATLHLAVSKFPVQAIPWFADQRVRGAASGSLDVSGGSSQAPRIQGEAKTTYSIVGSGIESRVEGHLNVDQHTLEGDLRVAQPDGSAEAKATVGLSWPTLGARAEPFGASRVALSAKNFRAIALLPALQDYVRDLDGRIDASASVETSSPTEPAKMDGAIHLRDGTVRLPHFGDEFRRVTANVTLDKDGVLRADDITAESVNGRVQGSALVRTRGLGFDSGTATLKIPERDAWPVVVEGQTFGEAWGSVRVDASNSKDKPGVVDVEATIPTAGIRLSTVETHSLQALDAAEHVRLGVYRSGAFVPLPTERPKEAQTESATSANVVLHLHDVEIRRGPGLRVRIEGDPVVSTRGELRVNGTLRLRTGFFEAEGKRFEIERGTVNFSGDPYNPEVVATAGWTAPDGTRIFADFVGPLKTGNVTLRSDPARSKNEILSLILFGSATGAGSPYAAGTTPYGAGAAGVAFGGQFATQGLNRAIDDLTGLDITTRIDTTDAANPRPEVELRLARDFSIAIAHVLGVPPPGTNPDRFLATFGWRFSRSFRLETTVGDQGSTVLDLVWQYRY